MSGCRGAAQPSRWLLWTIWLVYVIHFTPKFRGIHLTAVKAAEAHVLWGESLSYWRSTWWNRSLQPIWRQGFSALTSLCSRKAVGLCILNWNFHKTFFQDAHAEVHLRMHLSPRIGQAAVDLKDPYFHVVNPSASHRPFLRFCVRRTGITVQGPRPLGYPYRPCLHVK